MKVKFAKLHYPIHHPDTGTHGPTLANYQTNATKATPMEIVGDCIEVTLPHLKGGQPVVVAVPKSGFTHWVVEPDKANEAKNNGKATK